jgi:hypothetical protein
LKEERRGQSALARLVTPKPYQFEQLCDKVKNQHVQAVEEWIATTVKETLFEYIKSKAVEKTVEKRINEEFGDEP